eukprot:SAG11_NODE_31254_length_293_cov_1.061856_1_plen_34_part_01
MKHGVQTFVRVDVKLKKLHSSLLNSDASTRGANS